MYVPAHGRPAAVVMRGMGSSPAQTATAIGSSAASAATPSIATAIGISVPIVGAAIAGITLAINAWLNRMGPKQKVWTTQIANEAEGKLQENLAAWQGSEKTLSQQQAALANADALLAWVRAQCSNPQMGEPGQRCINERLVPGGAAPWCPTSDHTGCDWITLYRSPIAQDPGVQADPGVLDELAAAITGGGSSSSAPGAVSASGLWTALAIGVGVLLASEAL